MSARVELAMSTLSILVVSSDNVGFKMHFDLHCVKWKNRFLWHYSLDGNRFLYLYLHTCFHFVFSLDTGFTYDRFLWDYLRPNNFLVMYCIGNQVGDAFDEEVTSIVSNSPCLFPCVSMF